VDIQQEHQREMEGLLENVRQLSRELRQHMLVIDQFIPPEYQVSLQSFLSSCLPAVSLLYTNALDLFNDFWSFTNMSSAGNVSVA